MFRFIQDWKIKSSSLQIDLQHSFNMWMLLSWPWALLGSRFFINVAISSKAKAIAETDLSIFLRKFKGSSLELSILEHCWAKNKLNNSAFFFKSVTYLLSKVKEEYREFFCCLTMFLILTSKFLGLSSDSSIFFDIHK